jgi:predicted Zn-dependent protease with MMP-like domain
VFSVSREVFEAMVREAVDELPEILRTRMNNVAVVVKEHPSRSDLREARHSDEDDPDGLFGLYQGVPLPERGSCYDKVLPDLITIYQATHEGECDSLEELREEIRITIRHEIAHHFGIDDERLEELGAY